MIFVSAEMGINQGLPGKIFLPINYNPLTAFFNNAMPFGFKKHSLFFNATRILFINDTPLL
jgi:hypothetical protein